MAPWPGWPETYGKLYVQASEYEAAAAYAYTVPEWFQFSGAAYEQLEGEAEIATGVSVLPTPGHTPGCSSYRFGRHVFTGDALFMPTTGRVDATSPGGARPISSIR